MRFDRKKFFDGYRSKWGSLTPQQVTGLEQLLDFIEADVYIKRVDWAAYILGTTKHETADTFHPIHEYGSKSYFVKRYGGQTRKGKELGNDTPDEGYYYSGAGYPQTTGESNFEKAEDALRREYPEVVAEFERRTGRKFDLTIGDQANDTDDPKNMMDPAIAYATMSYGMRTGMFTGRKLSDYNLQTPQGRKAARRIINGQDRADLIAGYALAFESILKSSLIKGAALKPNADDVTELAQPESGGDLAGARVEIEDGSIKAETNVPLSQNVVIEKEKDPETEAPQGFFGALWKKITGALGISVTTDVAIEKAQQAQALGLSERTWTFIFYAVIGGLVLWVLYHFVTMKVVPWARWLLGRIRTHQLMQVNSTSTNNVVVADLTPERIKELEAAGWLVVRRS